jgi:uncharacterized protein (TIGR03000 family)
LSTISLNLPGSLNLPSLVLVGLVLAVVQHAPARDESPKARAVAAAEVRLKVAVPHKKAVLFVEGKESKGEGARRSLTFSPAKDGKSSVTLKVVWDPNAYTKITRVRKLEVEPGKSYEVDLERRDEKTDPKDDIVVIYVPTPDEVVDKMAELAGVGKEDVVFDLGCGDGRMVCRAVAMHKAKRGVGIDIDPERVTDSQETAKKYKVEDRVAFRQGDVLKPIKDLSEATVVMLYMGDDIGERLAPILRSTLKPGSRVVSHQFSLGDWKPDKSITVQDSDMIEYELHLWVVKEEKQEKQEKKR